MKIKPVSKLPVPMELLDVILVLLIETLVPHVKTVSSLKMENVVNVSITVKTVSLLPNVKTVKPLSNLMRQIRDV